MKAVPARTVRRLIIADMVLPLRRSRCSCRCGLSPCDNPGASCGVPLTLRVQRWLSYSYSQPERIQHNIPSYSLINMGKAAETSTTTQRRKSWKARLFRASKKAVPRSLGGGAQVLAHVLLEDGLEVAVAQVLLDGGVNRILQCGLVLGQQNGDVGAGADLTLQQAQVGVRVLLEVLGERDGVVGGQLGAAGEHLLDGLVEAGDLDDGGAAFFHELAVVAGGTLGGAVAGNLGGVLQARVFLHTHAGTGVCVGHGEVVLLLALLGGCHVVEHDVVAARVHAGDKRVPGGFDVLGGHAQVLGEGLGDVVLEAGELTGGVVVGVGAVGTLHADADFARGLDGLQQVGGALCGACAGAVTARTGGEQAGGSGEGRAQ
ncbi:protein chain release factor B [Rothia mucilaginosa DY-18]|uniref:Protein chain release factor B n=1 Tax=Rothia mucilaginosa (strain DY-18) TaxID=680646 RepID=D2NPX1_ROTMD|nr:protein chain release factor B [Rothia mucilaginosa DY-18]